MMLMLKDVHQASVWFNPVCQASEWLNIRLSAVHHASI